MSGNDDGHQLREALETNFMKIERECVKPHEPGVFPPWARYRNDLRQMICEGDFDFTAIFEEVAEGGTYTDISNEGADALADYLIGLFEVIDENRGEAFTASAVNANYEKNEIPGIKAVHTIVTDECRRKVEKTRVSAFTVAMQKLEAEIEPLINAHPIGSGVKFHFVLTVESQKGE